MNNILKEIMKYKTISIIGLAKNVGKTTTLNYLLKHLRGVKKVGLTSIGRDGENTDIVTNTPKPRIYIEKGTVVATTRDCLKSSDFTMKILKTTSINTPMGEVIVVEALSDGFVDLAGPSLTKQMKEVIEIFNQNGVDITLIDGAASRKSIANHYISEASILCTGASYHSNLNVVCDDSIHYLNLLQLPKIEADLNKQFSSIKSNVSIIDNEMNIKSLDLKTALDAEKEIVDAIDKQSQYLIIKGALSKKLIETLLMHRNKYKQLTIVVENGTKCMLEKEMNLLNKLSIKVLHPIQVLFVSVNPTSPYGYHFDEKVFLDKLQKRTNLKVINVRGVDHESFY